MKLDHKPTIVPSGAGGAGDVVPYEEAHDKDYRPETPEDAEREGPDEDWQFWMNQIKAGLVAERRWRKEAMECERSYFGPDDDPGEGGEKGKSESIDENTAMIHANIDVLKPMLFSETPTPIARRRFRGDGKSDPTDVLAAETAQRLAQYILDTTDFDETMESARDDWLIVGRGAARVYYDAQISQIALPSGEVMEVKASESVYCRYVEWRRYVNAPSHSWHKLPWLAFEVPMTRTMVKQRFGDEIAAGFNFNHKGIVDTSHTQREDDRDSSNRLGLDTETGEPAISPFDTAMVYEVWNKDSGEVLWVSPSYSDGILDRVDDPLMLEKFWPMAKPLLATTKGDQLNPRPDIKYYERRAKEVQAASDKMRVILKTISVSALYPGQNKGEVEKLLAGDNVMIAVSDWIGLMEKGGANEILQWLPLQHLIAALQALSVLRDAAKQAMFEASGVSDIMRAQGDPNETATAQNLKGKYAATRLKDKQRRMAHYARDTLVLMVELALEHFDTKTIADICALDLPLTEAEREQIAMAVEQAQQEYAMLMEMHGMLKQAIEAGVEPGPVPPAPPEPELPEVPVTSWELIHDRLRSDYMRKITVTIETDSTILADEQQDKEARVEFLSAFAGFVQTVAPLAATGQFDGKVIKELLMFGVRGFPKSRTLESMISELPDEPQQEQAPDVQVQVAKIKAEVDAQIEAMRQDNNEKDRQHDILMKRAEKGVDLMAKAAEMASEAQTPQSQTA